MIEADEIDAGGQEVSNVQARHGDGTERDATR